MPSLKTMCAFRVTVSLVCAMCVQGIFRNDIKSQEFDPESFEESAVRTGGKTEKVSESFEESTMRTRAGMDSQGVKEIEDWGKLKFKGWEKVDFALNELFSPDNCGGRRRRRKGLTYKKTDSDGPDGGTPRRRRLTSFDLRRRFFRGLMENGSVMENDTAPLSSDNLMENDMGQNDLDMETDKDIDKETDMETDVGTDMEIDMEQNDLDMETDKETDMETDIGTDVDTDVGTDMEMFFSRRRRDRRRRRQPRRRRRRRQPVRPTPAPAHDGLKIEANGSIQLRRNLAIPYVSDSMLDVSGFAYLKANYSKSVSKNWNKKAEYKIPVPYIGFIVVGFEADVTLSGSIWIAAQAQFDFRICVKYKGLFRGGFEKCKEDDYGGKPLYSKFTKGGIDYYAGVSVSGSAKAFVRLEIGPAGVSVSPSLDGTLSIGNGKCSAAITFAVGVKVGPLITNWINSVLDDLCLDQLDPIDFTLEATVGIERKCLTGFELTNAGFKPIGR